jgi:hypothetical protein
MLQANVQPARPAMHHEQLLASTHVYSHVLYMHWLAAMSCHVQPPASHTPSCNNTLYTCSCMYPDSHGWLAVQPASQLPAVRGWTLDWRLAGCLLARCTCS